MWTNFNDKQTICRDAIHFKCIPELPLISRILLLYLSLVIAACATVFYVRSKGVLDFYYWTQNIEHTRIMNTQVTINAEEYSYPLRQPLLVYTRPSDLCAVLTLRRRTCNECEKH